MTLRMSDGTVVKTENATENWEGDQKSNGSNLIDVNTHDQWSCQTLYRSRKGRYYIVTESKRQGQPDRAEWISNEEAARWLVLNEKPVPAELQPLELEVTE